MNRFVGIFTSEFFNDVDAFSVEFFALKATIAHAVKLYGFMTPLQLLRSLLPPGLSFT
jgi:hypothetical protein